tara:strand:- start:2033 stop:2707 length:675 start_codon:yes stop_codon:yes gene_type:complete
VKESNLLLKLLLSNSKVYNNLSVDKNFNKIINKLHERSVVLDIGANLGNVSSYILEKKNCNIYLFEPNTLCFEILKRRFIDDNRIKIYNLAISNFSGKSNLYLHNKSKGISDSSYLESSSLKEAKDNVSKNNYIEINVLNIEDLLSKFETIDLIKIDIEGSEYEIMPLLVKNRSKIKCVLCELHGKPSTDIEFTKNKDFIPKYEKLIKLLKEKNLYGNWFYEWY